MSTVQLEKATIDQVAEYCGVSASSVSRALNGKPGIGEKTRQRILEACKQLNYNPSAAARKLSSGNSTTVAILLGECDLPISPYVALVYNHFLHALNKRGLVPELIPFAETARVSERAGAAIVLASGKDDSRLPLLEQQRIPYVCIGQKSQGRWVAPDEFNGIRQITQQLLSEGKTRLKFLVADDGGGIDHNLRLQGFASAMSSAALPVDVIKFQGLQFQGIKACAHLLRQPELLESCDALVCNTDEIALGAIEALSVLNIEVPTQIAVTGFDDLPQVSASLSTVRQDLRAIASQAVTLLDEARHGLLPRGVISPVEIIRRETA